MSHPDGTDHGPEVGDLHLGTVAVNVSDMERAVGFGLRGAARPDGNEFCVIDHADLE